MAERLLLLEAAASSDGSSPMTPVAIRFKLIIRGLSRIRRGRTQVSSVPANSCNFDLNGVFLPAEPVKAGGERGDMKRRMISCLGFAVLGSVFALGQDVVNDRHDLRADRRDLRQDRVDRQADRQDIRRDERDIAKDRRDMRNDLRKGNYKDARRDARDIRKDLRNGRKDIRNDRRDLRADRRDIRDDRRK